MRAARGKQASKINRYMAYKYFIKMMLLFTWYSIFIYEAMPGKEKFIQNK